MGRAADVSPRNVAVDALSVLLRQMQRCTPLVARRETGEDLHDLRVGIRRVRTVARMFRPLLWRTSYPAIDRSLARMADMLGKVRDDDIVLMQYELWLDRYKRSTPKALRYRACLRDRLRRKSRGVARMVRTAAWRADLGVLQRVICEELPRVRYPHCTAKAYVVETMNAALNAMGTVRAGQMSPTPLHELRSRVRRARYVAEVAAAVLGAPALRVRVALKNVTDALGIVHDMDIMSERLSVGSAAYPRWVPVLVKRRRSRSLTKFRKVWKALKRQIRESKLPLRSRRSQRGRTMELYVIRHGVAEDAGSGSDDARVLSEKGKTRTDAVARALAVLEWKPGLILHSPLIRARQTARILARHASGTLAVSACAALAPGVDIAQMCAVLQKLDTDCVAVVGHMPHLERLVSALVTGDNRLSVALKKAGVCRVDFSGPVLAGHGVLSWLLQPRHLLAIAAEH